MPPAIEAVKIRKVFGSAVAVADVDVVIEPGEFFSLLGPSGCGKTTLLRMIAGFEEPTSGRICIGGADMTGVDPHKRPVNLVFQSYALFPHLSVFDNIAFGLRAQGTVEKAEIPAKVKWALELVRLEQFAHKVPRQLSGGQQQRVALARAIVNSPQVLLLDEPLSALDLKIRQEMQAELARLQGRLGMTFVMVTHDQGEALALSNRIALFNRGHLEQVGSPQQIFEQPQTAFVAEFIGQTNVIAASIQERNRTYVKVAVPGPQCLWVKDNPALSASEPGQAVIVWIRTQAVSVVARDSRPAEQQPADGEEPVNCLDGVVVHLSYQGTSTDYHLLVNEGFTLRASVPAALGNCFSRGERVSVILPASSLSLLPAASPASGPSGDERLAAPATVVGAQ